MLSYRIANPSAPPKRSPPPRHRVRNRATNIQETNIPFLSKQSILERHVQKCWIAEGDTVKFKKPKKNPIKGTVVHIEEDVDKVVWRNTTPQFITVRQLTVVDGLVIGYKDIPAGVKQLLYVSSK